MAGPPLLPLLAPLGVEPSPTPTQITVGDRRFPQGRAIILQVITPSNVGTYFLTEAGVDQLIKDLQAARGGVVLAKPGEMPK